VSPDPPGFDGGEIDLSTVDSTPDLVRCIHAQTARHYRVLPVFQTRTGALGVAVTDPGDIDTMDSLTHLLHREIELRQADGLQLGTFLRRLYGADQ